VRHVTALPVAVPIVCRTDFPPPWLTRIAARLLPVATRALRFDCVAQPSNWFAGSAESVPLGLHITFVARRLAATQMHAVMVVVGSAIGVQLVNRFTGPWCSVFPWIVNVVSRCATRPAASKVFILLVTTMPRLHTTACVRAVFIVQATDLCPCYAQTVRTNNQTQQCADVEQHYFYVAAALHHNLLNHA